ncbi:MAG TPA: tRNA (adenosine(37)-N6)-dimethylallyltransferase MiaA [Candidatus Limiplasma pullistercoris]|nr:tRNA (adenosine(37)-N6)-dimethylallyltransferase MiaA [Candidatus Limiplasma pullistercoris]
MGEKPAVIAVAGPTASGKSDLGLKLAQRLGGEIVCMDSMQIYRRMDIGTAKPTAQERALLPHHMLDVADPTEAYAVADYAVAAEQVIAQILSRGRVPILVGGTGLYLKALMDGLSLGGAGGDERLRAELNALADEPGGKERLHARLAAVDPETAARLHPNDRRRVIRAIEVFEQTGVPMSRQNHAAQDRPFRVLPLALEWPRDLLYARLETRVHRMMEMGLLSEVRALLESGVAPAAQSMQGIGYKELIPAAMGQDDVNRAVWDIIVHTRHYAKRQGTWLRAEPRCVWLDARDADGLMSKALALAQAFLNDTKEQDE